MQVQEQATGTKVTVNQTTANLAEEKYARFADRVVEQGIMLDPWVDGAPRLAEAPTVLGEERLRELYTAAEQVAAVYDEVVQLCMEQPSLLKSFFQLTPWQHAMWTAAAPLWHVIARADIFLTDEGLAFTEINSDTPSGAPEAAVLGELAHADAPDLRNPSAELEPAFCSAIEQLAAAHLQLDPEQLKQRLAAGEMRVGFVFPTEHTEDHSMIRLYRQWLEARGWRTAFGSPFNLSLNADGRAELLQEPIDVMVRHYKTDWWGERQSAWDDDHYTDQEPLGEALHAVFESNLSGKLCIVNPFGAIVPQNKRAMALMWEKIHTFSERSQNTIRRFIPYTARLETVHEQQLIAEKDQWVIKSDYGAEGDEVIIGKLASDAIWRATLQHARPGRWVAQRFFDALPNANGETVNHGVFLVAGKAVGLFSRAQAGVTDYHSLSAGVLAKSE